MSSPPSLSSLKISEEESAARKPSETGESSTTAPSPGDEDGSGKAPNGDAKEAGSAQHVENTLSPPAPAAARASPSAVPQRPSPAPPAASAPSVPGRIGAGGPTRGGLQGPMGMGMRGRGGPSRGPPTLPPSLQAKMDKVAQRSGAGTPGTPSGGAPNPNATSMGALLRSQALGQQQGRGGPGVGSPSGSGSASASGSGSGTQPQMPGPASGPLGLAARRAAAGGAGRPTLSSMGTAPGGLAARRGPPGGLNLSGMAGQGEQRSEGGGPGAVGGGNRFTDYQQIMDPSGSLRFSSKATLTAKGVEFEDGASFKINMDEMEIVGELGKGNYGSVQQVFHRPTGIMMAMKEIRLELDESKLNGIIMELDILHRAVAPEIVEFYGAFTIESCVYYCMELMDAGSLDTLTGGGVPANQVKETDEAAELRVPEPVLRRITASMVKGLKFLKDELQIMHRDVKPTNVLINKKGEVKLVDFGVSGQLEKSLAKTNIGCQSYMAPERIKGESQGQSSSYTVSSDVWSVGLSIIELAKGCYPYPPETFANVFAQLTAIVHGAPPTLPAGYSADAHDFVAKCLTKEPSGRPTYAQLLQHPFLAADKDAEVDMAGWVVGALEKRAARGVIPLQPIEA